MVFYRKYRPQTISELDLSSVRDKLSAILKSKDLPHAFLFTGPKGLGKTSSARILAKAISCQNRHLTKNDELGTENKEKVQSSKSSVLSVEDIEPCNKCDACISITNGSNIDILEIDAASNRGVDEIRDLREKIKFSPVSLSKKVYIIDEVHMLTTEAFNALLKTLEEPPEHAVFILCTTESWKLPSTIISRAFVVNFEKPNSEELSRSIKRILEGEGLALEEGMTEPLYNISDGSFRDAAKIIEELSLLSKDKKITRELFEQAYKSQSIEAEVKEFTNFLLKKDIKNSLTVIEKLANMGADFKIVNEKIVDYLRDMLLAKMGVLEADIKPEADLETIKKMLELFNESYKEVRFSVLPQLPLELASVKWLEIEKEQKTEEKKTKPLEKWHVQAKPQPAIEKKEEIKKEPMVIHQKTIEDSKDKGFRELLIDKINQENHSIAALLRSCRISTKDSHVEIVTPYKFHGEKLKEIKTQEILKRRLIEMSGEKTTFSVIIENAK